MNIEKDFEKNTSLVWHVINKYSLIPILNKHGFTEDDGFQLGCIALMKCINNFDENANIKFASYAVPSIYGEIMNGIRNHGHSLKVSRRSWSAYNKIRKLDKVPSVEEVMKAFNIDERYAKEAIELLDLKLLSADAPVNNGKAFNENKNTENVIDIFLSSENNELELTFDKKLEYEERMALLNEKQRMAIELSLRGLTQREIAPIIGCTQVHVSRIIKKGLKIIEERYETV
jgi:RNA polymerase sporulation-specific sigma factor